jgi:hypothetical protein
MYFLVKKGKYTYSYTERERESSYTWDTTHMHILELGYHTHAYT